MNRSTVVNPCSAILVSKKEMSYQATKGHGGTRQNYEDNKKISGCWGGMTVEYRGFLGQ